jgi:hypothetical protein
MMNNKNFIVKQITTCFKPVWRCEFFCVIGSGIEKESRLSSSYITPTTPYRHDWIPHLQCPCVHNVFYVDVDATAGTAAYLNKRDIRYVQITHQQPRSSINS